MRYWIEFRDGLVKEFDADDFQSAFDNVNELGITKVKDWDVFSFRAPPREPEAKEVFKYLPC